MAASGHFLTLQLAETPSSIQKIEKENKNLNTVTVDSNIVSIDSQILDSSQAQGTSNVDLIPSLCSSGEPWCPVVDCDSGDVEEKSSRANVLGSHLGANLCNDRDFRTSNDEVIPGDSRWLYTLNEAATNATAILNTHKRYTFVDQPLPSLPEENESDNESVLYKEQISWSEPDEALVFNGDSVLKSSKINQAKDFIKLKSKELVDVLKDGKDYICDEYFNKDHIVSKFSSALSIAIDHLNDFIATLRNFLKKYKMSFEIDFDNLFYLISGFNHLLIAPDLTSMTLALITMIKSFFNINFESYRTRIMVALNSFLGNIFPERVYAEALGFSEKMSLSTIFKSVVSSKIVRSFKTLILTLVSMRFFPKVTAIHIQRIIGPVEKSSSYVDLIAETLDAIEVVSIVKDDYDENKDLIGAISRSDPLADFINKTHKFLYEYKDVYIGDAANFVEEGDPLLNGRKPARPFLLDLGEWIKRGNSLVDSGLGSNSFKAHLSALKEIYRSVRSKVGHKKRKAPLGIIVTGPPGIGKSHIKNLLYRAFCKHRGWNYSSDLVYNRPTKSKYWTGYDSFANPIIEFSEVGSLHNNIASKTGDEILNEVLLVVDVAPYMPEMAAVEEKGKEFCSPQLFVIDTNNPDLNAKVAVNNPAALFRRFDYIFMDVRPEYRKQGTTMLDSAKAKLSDDPQDLWTFNWVKRIPQGNYSFVSERHGKADCNVYEMIEEFFEVMKRHDADQSSFESVMSQDISAYLKKEKIAKAESFGTDFILHTVWDKATCHIASILFLYALFQPTILLIPLAYEIWSLIGIQSYCHMKWRDLFAFEFVYRYYYFKKVFKDILYVKWKLGFEYVKFGGKLCWLFAKSFVLGTEEFEVERTKLVASYFNMEMCAFFFLLTIGILRIFLKFFRMFTPFFVQAEGAVSSTGRFSDGKAQERIEMIEGWAGAKFPEPKKRGGGDATYDTIETFHARVIGDQKIIRNQPEELMNKANANLRFIRVLVDGNYYSAMGLGLCNDLLLMNRHLFLNKDKFELIISRSDFANDEKFCKITSNDVFEVNDDIVLVRTYVVTFKDIKSLFVDFPLDVRFPGVFKGQSVSTQVIFGVQKVNVTQDLSFDINMPLLYNYKEHSQGDCGTPVFLSNGAMTFIGGIHSGGYIKGPESFAVVLQRTKIQSAYDRAMTGRGFVVASEGKLRLPEGARVVEVSEKSPLLFESTRSLDVMGRISNFPFATPRSSLLESPLIPHIEKIVGISPYGENGKLKFLPPMMRPTKVNGVTLAPYNNWIKKVGVGKKPLDHDLMHIVVDTFVKHLIRGLEAKGVGNLSPFPIEVAQNGFPDNFYVRGMKNSTSAGPLFRGTKKEHSVPYKNALFPDGRMPDNEVLEQVVEVISAYENDECAYNLVGAQLKDEPRPSDKVAVGKTRVFSMSSYEATLVNRMFLMPFYSLMCEHRDVFYTKVGVNMLSREAHEMRESLASFSELIMEGDYGGYDTSMPIEIGYMANDVVYRVLKHFGYNRYALKVVKGILSDNLHPLVCLDGNLFVASGLQPSGKYATAEDNSLRGVLLLLYFFVEECTLFGGRHRLVEFRPYLPVDFFRLVLPVTYGDDMLCAVKPELSKAFNNIKYSEFVARVFGMEFTSAAKDVHLKEFATINEISFLKRTFRFNSQLKVYVAVLDKESIVKSLSYILPSSAVSVDQQIVETAASSLRELFLWTITSQNEPYTELRKKFLLVLENLSFYERIDLNRYLPTFDVLWADFVEKYNVSSSPSTAQEVWGPWK